MILDSSFLVDFERESAKSKAGRATQFLQAQPHEELCITFTIAGEMAAGESMGRDRAKWETFIRPFRFLDYNDEIAWRFGDIYRELRRRGTLIGANDMWIAATALTNDQPIVTRNADDFNRVPGLEVLSY
ncbi:MAG: type II toxin-antitoxin system VapC family toxin [Chthoniobacterales bacterium]